MDLPDDSNGDGIIDARDGDHNGNGQIDDLDLDFNGDGLVDSGDDINADGVVNFEDFDVNGDGFVDIDDDLNFDGAINSLDVADNNNTNTDPVDCEGEAGTDHNSSTSPWNDNCEMRDGVSYRDSSYSRGIQRILWCQGFAGTAELSAFADGSFGPNTATAVTAFQQANNITPQDGIVGPITWDALQGTLELIPNGNDGTTTAYGVTSVDCNGQAQFFQDNATGSWRIADVPGGASANSLVFSTRF